MSVDTRLQIHENSIAIERQICGEDRQYHADAITRELNASPDAEIVSEGDCTLSNKSSRSLLTAVSDSPELSDASSLRTQSIQTSDEDLDLTSERWREFCSVLNEGSTEAQPEPLSNILCEDAISIESNHRDYQSIDLKEGGAYELEATEIQENGTNAVGSVASNEGKPPIITESAAVDATQAQHETFVPTITNEEVIGPAHTLAILLVLVYLVFEIALTLISALWSHLSVRK
ncbi:uncharacterized protein N0V89_001970 [Didymosphaeria variabile]|uniref:Uncharacterized protein n=1 Tax=Didymosphaeria variabile TaxID=1932322 RepID=A0A9W9CDY6_9PLEO|nr:uncharacterized protein N0V89_001970 [Didymosphaeria variabile]KAJ4357395.1 hypothetical protein N0V89_001970 [Didymosphaeria variabile]